MNAPGVSIQISTLVHLQFTSICLVLLAVYLSTRPSISEHCRAVLRDETTVCGLDGHSDTFNGDEPWKWGYGPGMTSLLPCNVHTATSRSHSTADSFM